MKTLTLHQYRTARFEEWALELVQMCYFDMAEKYMLPDEGVMKKAKIKAALSCRKAGNITLYNYVLKL
jgi:hypothetical protein